MKIISGYSEDSKITFDTNEGQTAFVYNANGKRYGYITITKDRKELVGAKEKILIITLDVILFCLTILINKYYPLYILGSYITFGMVINLFTLIPSVLEIKNISKEDFKYHSAEHIMYKYYTKHGMLPQNINEVKNISSLCGNCGTIILGNKLERDIAIALFAFLVKPSILVLAIYIFFDILGYLNISLVGLIIQLIVTRKPENIHLETSYLCIKILEMFKDEKDLIDAVRNEEKVKKFLNENSIDYLIIDLDDDQTIINR